MHYPHQSPPTCPCYPFTCPALHISAVHSWSTFFNTNGSSCPFFVSSPCHTCPHFCLFPHQHSYFLVHVPSHPRAQPPPLHMSYITYPLPIPSARRGTACGPTLSTSVKFMHELKRTSHLDIVPTPNPHQYHAIKILSAPSQLPSQRTLVIHCNPPVGK